MLGPAVHCRQLAWASQGPGSPLVNSKFCSLPQTYDTDASLAGLSSKWKEHKNSMWQRLISTRGTCKFKGEQNTIRVVKGRGFALKTCSFLRGRVVKHQYVLHFCRVFHVFYLSYQQLLTGFELPCRTKVFSCAPDPLRSTEHRRRHSYLWDSDSNITNWDTRQSRKCCVVDCKDLNWRVLQYLHQVTLQNKTAPGMELHRFYTKIWRHPGASGMLSLQSSWVQGFMMEVPPLIYSSGGMESMPLEATGEGGAIWSFLLVHATEISNGDGFLSNDSPHQLDVL